MINLTRTIRAMGALSVTCGFLTSHLARAEVFLEAALPAQYFIYSQGKEVRPLYTALGLAATCGFFVSDSMAVTGGYEFNAGSRTIVMQGFEAGLNWYLLGGATTYVSDSNIKFSVSRNYSVALSGGIMHKNFNFKEFDSTAPSQLVVGKRPITEGDFGGFYLGLKNSQPISSKLSFVGGLSASQSFFSSQANVLISRVKVELGVMLRDPLAWK